MIYIFRIIPLLTCSDSILSLKMSQRNTRLNLCFAKLQWLAVWHIAMHEIPQPFTVWLTFNILNSLQLSLLKIFNTDRAWLTVRNWTWIFILPALNRFKQTIEWYNEASTLQHECSCQVNSTVIMIACWRRSLINPLYSLFYTHSATTGATSDQNSELSGEDNV